MATVMATPINTNHQDDMEIADAASTDMDFDIDFDATGEAHYTNEDEMQDDVPQITEPEDIELRSVTADPEDYMIDDTVQEVTELEQQDGEMIDDPLDPLPDQAVDEELLDFSDEELDSTPHLQIRQQGPYDGTSVGIAQVQTAHASHSPAPVDNVPTLEFHPPEATATIAGNTQGADLTALAEDIPAHEPSAESGGRITPTEIDPHVEESDKATIDSNAVNEQPAASTKIETQPNTEISQPNIAEAEAHKADDGNEEDDRQVESFQPAEELTFEHEANDQLVAVVPGDVEAGDIEEHVTAATDSPRSNSSSEGKHTYTGLHTTVVKYAGGEYTLFPSSEPSDGEEYFLQNENLASGSIGDLLQACRGTLGEAITEDEELELHVEDLGLYLSEDSTAAFSTSFSELLDIFVQLHRQDGNEQPPPVTVSLTSKPRFINRLTLLANAAAEGKGLSQLGYLFPQAEEAYSYDEDHHTERAPSEPVDGEDDTNDKHLHHEGHEHYGEDHEAVASYTTHHPTNDEPSEEQVQAEATEQQEDNLTSRTLSPNHGETHDASNDEGQDQDDQDRQEQQLFEDDGGYADLSAQISSGDSEHYKSAGDNIGNVANNVLDHGDQLDHGVQQVEEAAEDFGDSLDEAATNPVDAPSEAAIADAKAHEHNSESAQQAADEFDEIDFEDDDYDNDGVQVNENATGVSAGKDETKHINKRGFAELAEGEEQESKRPRSS